MPIPPETIWEMERNYEEWLPKTVRVKTATLESKRAKSYARAKELGLIDLLSSESFVAFAEAIAGRKLKRKGGQQVLCYGPGDYAGPHNDHHPEDKGYERAISTSTSRSARRRSRINIWSTPSPAISPRSCRCTASARSPSTACRSGT